MSARIRCISTLKICQKAGTVTIQRDPISKCAKIKASFHFVLHINHHENTIFLYGLGDCGTFSISGRKFQRYIENSSIRVIGSIIFENRMRRSAFTSPSTEIILPHRYALQLSRIEVKGKSKLGNVAQIYISNPRENTFHVSLSEGAQLVASLPISSLHCTLSEHCAIRTCTALNETTRLLWILDYLYLEFTGKGTVSGIYIKKELTVRDTHNSTIEISKEEQCNILHERSPVFGVPPSPIRQPVINEHGMVVWEEQIDQDILDVSRASYEAESQKPSTSPLFSICGDQTGQDKIAEKDDPLCTVCMINCAMVAMGGCGHRATCISCTKQMCTYSSTCPVCRKPIGTAVINFISR